MCSLCDAAPLIVMYEMHELKVADYYVLHVAAGVLNYQVNVR